MLRPFNPSAMLSLKQIMIIWGSCDICSIGWFVGWRIFHAEIPFYYDIIRSIKTSKSIGEPSFVLITVFSLVLYVSLVFSGTYLIKLQKVGAILSYIQTPFRLLTLLPPSIFFISWPLKYLFSNPQAISAIGTLIFLVLVSEFLKLWSIIRWHRFKSIA